MTAPCGALKGGRGEGLDWATEGQLAERRKQMATFTEMYKKLLVSIAFTFLEPLPVGLLFTLLTAVILSRRPRVPGAVVA